MRQHGSLWESGGARGVLDVDHVVRPYPGLTCVQFPRRDSRGQLQEVNPAEDAGPRLSLDADNATQSRTLRRSQFAWSAGLDFRADLGQQSKEVGRLEAIG